MNNWQKVYREYTNIDSGDPRNVLEWVWDKFKPNIFATSSFQSQSMPLLHMISNSVPELNIIFLDTGFHFAETLTYRDQIVEQFGLNVLTIKPEVRKDTFIRQHGGELYKTNPDLCCYANKVEPLNKRLIGMDAWVSGIRRDQTSQRATIPIIKKRTDGIIKVSPLAGWTDKDIWKYIHDHNLPVHPLMPKGYRSIGCAPCTRPVISGEEERAGRWFGQDKTECGLHLPVSEEKFEE